MQIARHQLTDEEQELINRHLPFYQALAHGDREATTEAQKRFIQVTQGQLKAETLHEYAYMKWRQNQAFLDRLAHEELALGSVIPRSYPRKVDTLINEVTLD